jgi:hypothetical protein
MENVIAQDTICIHIIHINHIVSFFLKGLNMFTY